MEKKVYGELCLLSQCGDMFGDNLSAAQNRTGEGDFPHSMNLFCV
jgi:hypothetical protein